MATTIIDELVVSLGLDTQKFTEGQRQAEGSLRALEAGAERTGARFGDIGVDVLAFLKILEAPSRTIRRHLETIAAPAQTAQRQIAAVGAQARRTSVAGEAGLAGLTVGVRALSVAGLVAVATFESLKKVIESASASATKTFGVGIGAAAAGMPVGEFSAVSQALLTHANVPESETQSWLAGIKQFQENLQLGIVGPQMQARGKLGINPVGLTPEQIMEQLAAKFAGERDVAQVISQGASVGLSQAQSVALRNAGARLPGEISEARRTAVTDRDVRAATDLLNAENKLGVAWEKLSRDLFTDLDPALVRVIDDLTKFVNWLDSLNGILGQLSTADDQFSSGIGQIISALNDLLHGKFAQAWKDLATSPGATKALPAPAGDLAKLLPRATPEQIAVLSEIRQRESGGNLHAQNPTGSSSGWFGMTDSTWRMALQATQPPDVAGQYAHEKDAPAEIQAAAAYWLATRYGVNASISWQDSGVSKGRPYPTVPGFPAAGSPQIGAAPIAPPPGVQGMLQGAQRGALAMNSSSVTNANDNSRTATANVGQIVVNTASTDPRGVVMAIREAVNRNLLVGQANSGLA